MMLDNGMFSDANSDTYPHFTDGLQRLAYTNIIGLHLDLLKHPRCDYESL